ncbi:MAG: hypothetical protein KDI05_16960 [Halieaceae bacterium]|nr:hypothetical protein [Halieaceae bacterium]MCP5164501.1 hypothetical protein [Pseudomonadales bacterium]MCP5204363.1 hypothetical protein [Pseudomonadales bacterium]
MNKLKPIAFALLATTLFAGNANASSGDLRNLWSRITSYFQSGHNEQHGTHERNQFQEHGGGLSGGTHQHFRGCGHGGGGGNHQVPEMDVAGAGIALGLLGALAAVRRERINAKKLPEIS